MINPYSQVLFVWELMRQIEYREFAATYWRASLLSFGVYLFFAVTGEFLFERIFQVRLDAFRIFGGLLILMIAFRYFSEGAGSNLLFRGKAEDLAPHISLPFMVGPGTIWVSIQIGQNLSLVLGIVGIALILLLNLCFVLLIHRFIFKLEGYKETLLGKYIGILMRVNALFVGAIAVEMILTGIEGIMEHRALLP